MSSTYSCGHRALAGYGRDKKTLGNIVNTFSKSSRKKNSPQQSGFETFDEKQFLVQCKSK